MVRALEAFVPDDSDGTNVLALNELFEGFHELPGREAAVPAMFDVLERFPDAGLGNPGRIVHELEGIPGGVAAALLESVRRRPCFYTTWMLNRMLNTDLDAAGRRPFVEALRALAGDEAASDWVRSEAREFLEFQGEV